MDLIQVYNSDDSFIEHSESQDSQLDARQVRQVYLITYSQADTSIFPTRRSFANAVTKHFATGMTSVDQWVCCYEEHTKTGGWHYHLAIKLNKNKRWLAVKEAVQREYGVVLNFSNHHKNYYSAWQYVTKSDKESLQSDNHSDLSLQSSPRTSQASKRCITKRKQNKTRTTKKAKQKRLTNISVSDIIRNKNIKTKTELYALAEIQKQNGKLELCNFIINRNSKKIEDLINTTWDLKMSVSNLLRAKNSRLEILRDNLNKQCEVGCSDQWYIRALETLERNEIPAYEFSNSILLALEKGRGKFRNVLTVGPANCGKTFLLKPLTKVFESFVNPASSTFAWVGVDNAEIIFLNDFRWSSQIIPWHDLLLLLEGESVHLPAPKTHFAKDILLQRDTPIFSTSSKEIQFIKSGVISERETEMMKVRWRVFQFNYRISESQQKELPPCARCFSKLILEQ